MIASNASEKSVYKIKNSKNVAHKTINNSDNEEFIFSNEIMGSILNNKGELQVGDSVYKYTNQGIFIAHINNRNTLDYFPNSNSSKTNQNDVNLYVPNPGILSEFTIESVDECNNPIVDPDHFTTPDPYFGCGGGTAGSGNVVDFENPDTNNYIYCDDNNRDSWVDNIFGRTYVCEYFFDSRSKIRTIYAAEDFYFFTDVYSQAKFKKKDMFGFWYSSRDANTVYVMNKKAILQTERVKRGFNLSINFQDVERIYNDIYSFFLSNPNHKAVSVTNVYDSSNNQVTRFITDPANLLAAASTQPSVFSSNNKVNEPILEFNFKDFFGKKVDKAITVNILGLSKSISNIEIIRLSHQILSGYNADQYKTTGTGAIVFTYQDPSDLGKKAEPVCYALYGEKTQVYDLTVARRDYNIPTDFSIDDLTIAFKQTHNSNTGVTNNYVGFKFMFSLSVVNAVDVELESGAFYNGAWGGSHFKVKY